MHGQKNIKIVNNVLQIVTEISVLRASDLCIHLAQTVMCLCFMMY